MRGVVAGAAHADQVKEKLPADALIGEMVDLDRRGLAAALADAAAAPEDGAPFARQASLAR